MIMGKFTRETNKGNFKKNRGSYMGAHVLFKVLNQLGKRDKM